MDRPRRSAPRMEGGTTRIRTHCPLGNRLCFGCLSSFTRRKAGSQFAHRRNVIDMMPHTQRILDGPAYEVTSHQFLLISLKIKNARPFSSSRSHSSLIPICLPFVENSLCASPTSSEVATFSVKRFAGDK